MKKIILLLIIFVNSPLISQANSELIPLMHSNYEQLIQLQEIVSSPQNFAKPSGKKKAHQIIKKLKKVSHQLPESIDQKRGLIHIGKIFKEYLKDIDQNFSHSDDDYLRYQLMTVSSFCYSCHVSMSTNHSFKDIENRTKKLKLSPLEKAEFYVATRQFDQARYEFEKVILDKNIAKSSSETWMKALRELIDLNIRVNNNSNLTLDLITKKINPEFIPDFFKNHFEIWKKDIISWNKEKKLDQNSSSQKLISKSKELIEKASKRQTFPSEIKSDVLYLRAINYLQIALSKNLKKKDQAQAFYLLAIANNSLEMQKLWNLDNYYLQSCIEIHPHSDQAQRCFELLLSEIYFSYSGSGGTEIPQDELDHLNRYKKLSKEK